MKKTIHINLSGMAFTIEEDAYEKLNSYLKAVETRLGSGEEAKETINDIESRIAELFAPVAHTSGTAIRLEDVAEVIKVLGNPDDYLADGEEEKPSQPKSAPVYIPKRLYRDPHSRVVAGVCSGLGTYFNVDPIVFRLLFVVGLFYGISILPYIILWIAIPKALTMEQRMQMYGGDLGQSRFKQPSAGAVYNPPSALNGVLRGVAIVFGILILVVSFISLVGLTIATLFSGPFISSIPEIAWVDDFITLVIGPSVTFPAFLGVLLVVGIPLLMLFYLGLQLIFQFKRGGKAIGATGLVLWLIGIGLLIYSGVHIATQFKHRETISQTQILESFSGDTLFVNQVPIPENNKGQRVFRSHGMKVWVNDGNLSIEGRPTIEIINGADRFAITIEKIGRGTNQQDAANNAKGAEYLWLKTDSVIQLDRIFTLDSGANLRDQRVKVIVEVPKNKQVKIDAGLSSLIR
jgi:phage shock protein PspC (stress-responsive transcriptional regulator)